MSPDRNDGAPAQSVATPPDSCDQQAAGRDVPRRERELEEAVEHTAGRPREVEAGGAGTTEVFEGLERLTHGAEIAGEECLPAEREPRGDDRPLGRPVADPRWRRRDPRSFPHGPAPSRRVPRLIHERSVDRPREGTVVLDERYRDADGPEAVHEVRGAVERIDQPTETGYPGRRRTPRR